MGLDTFLIWLFVWFCCFRLHVEKQQTQHAQQDNPWQKDQNPRQGFVSVFANEIQHIGPETNVDEFAQQRQQGMRDSTQKWTQLVTSLVPHVFNKGIH
jgi:hypothetical protein